ncbi:MAG: CvpA family protein [Bdellovibrionota bacterium]
MFDLVVVSIFLFFAISGFLKGIVSQFATIAGIILAFVFANAAAPIVSMAAAKLLGTSENTSRLIAPMIAGISIYFAVVLIGKVFEHQLVNKISGLKSMNRLGGAALSMLKGAVILMVLLFFLHFIPAKLVDAWAPKLYQSQTYQFSLRHNPLGREDIVQRFKNYRDQKKALEEAKPEKEKKKKPMEEVLGDYLMEQAMENPEELIDNLTK